MFNRDYCQKSRKMNQFRNLMKTLNMFIVTQTCCGSMPKRPVVLRKRDEWKLVKWFKFTMDQWYSWFGHCHRTYLWIVCIFKHQITLILHIAYYNEIICKSDECYENLTFHTGALLVKYLFFFSYYTAKFPYILSY